MKHKDLKYRIHLWWFVQRQLFANQINALYRFYKTGQYSTNIQPMRYWMSGGDLLEKTKPRWLKRLIERITWTKAEPDPRDISGYFLRNR